MCVCVCVCVRACARAYVRVCACPNEGQTDMADVYDVTRISLPDATSHDKYSENGRQCLGRVEFIKTQQLHFHSQLSSNNVAFR